MNIGGLPERQVDGGCWRYPLFVWCIKYIGNHIPFLSIRKFAKLRVNYGRLWNGLVSRVSTSTGSTLICLNFGMLSIFWSLRDERVYIDLCMNLSLN